MDPEHECYKHQGKGIWKAGATLSSLMPGWGWDGTSALAGFGAHRGGLGVTTVLGKRGTGTGGGAGVRGGGGGGGGGGRGGWGGGGRGRPGGGGGGGGGGGSWSRDGERSSKPWLRTKIASVYSTCLSPNTTQTSER